MEQRREDEQNNARSWLLRNTAFERRRETLYNRDTNWYSKSQRAALIRNFIIWSLYYIKSIVEPSFLKTITVSLPSFWLDWKKEGYKIVLQFLKNKNSLNLFLKQKIIVYNENETNEDWHKREFIGSRVTQNAYTKYFLVEFYFRNILSITIASFIVYNNDSLPGCEIFLGIN